MEASDNNLSRAIEELVREVKQELERQQAQTPSRVPALEAELASATNQIQSYTITLGKLDLSPATRGHVEGALDDSIRRQQELQTELEWERRAREQVEVVVDEEKIKAALSRLDQLLTGENLSLANIELALHIDRIQCFDDGRVRIRMCKLGALPAAAKLLASPESPSPTDVTDGHVKPRRRSRRSTSAADYGDRDIKELAIFSSDVNRYAGLDDMWFTVDEFRIPVRTAWVERKADEIYDYRAQHLVGDRHATTKLVEKFGKSRPTILKALRIAEERRKEAVTPPSDPNEGEQAEDKSRETPKNHVDPESPMPDEAA
jgi:hypothetical protein